MMSESFTSWRQRPQARLGDGGRSTQDDRTQAGPNPEKTAHQFGFDHLLHHEEALPSQTSAGQPAEAPPAEEPQAPAPSWLSAYPAGSGAAAASAPTEPASLAGLEPDPHQAWRSLLDELALQVPSATYDTWLRDTKLIAYEDGEFIVGLPNAYARDWLENRLRARIKRSLSSIMHRSVQVHFRVVLRTQHDGDESAAGPLYQQPESLAPVLHSGTAASPASSGEYRSSQLRSHHTFETFIVGSHNRLAHAAALAVADRPGERFNPLFIYGGVGLGKTHLLNAIGNCVLDHGYRMLYCSSEQFTNELILAIRKQSTEQFRNKYREVDILLIDDIQFIGGKESTQEEFFHTFNHLHASGKQVVVTSDRPPKALATLEERLRSRFEGGLQTDIILPDFETRVAILQSKAVKLGIPISQDILMRVAERVESNIRELEGALNRLVMQARLLNCRLDLGLAEAILDNLAPNRLPCPPSSLIHIVAAHFGLVEADLTGRRRTQEMVVPRQIAMYLLREEHGLSLPAIGQLLGGRDHSTVRYGVEKVTADLERDEDLRRKVTALRNKIYTPFV